MGIARTSAILSGALLAKALLSPAYSASVRVSGLQDFLNVLYSAERQQGRGVVTVCNHIST
jgi:monolysocardiolipin acyltransferase